MITNSTLSKSFRKSLVPTLDIDLVWHAHQSNHENYVKICLFLSQEKKIVFDHDDTIGHTDLEKAYASTYFRWARVYNETYSPYKPKYEAWMQDKQCSQIFFPLALYRQFKWRKYVTLAKPPSLPVANPVAITVPDSGTVQYAGSISVVATPVMESKVCR